jgi:hypothetical protein
MAEKKAKHTSTATAVSKEIYNDSHDIPRARGNGQLRRQVSVDANGNVMSYSLAYINHAIHAGDNGRVVGYDNAHGFHHRHYFGTIEPINFVSYEDIEERFAQDWMAFRSEK